MINMTRDSLQNIQSHYRDLQHVLKKRKFSERVPAPVNKAVEKYFLEKKCENIWKFMGNLKF